MDGRLHRAATPIVAGVVVLVIAAAVGASLGDDDDAAGSRAAQAASTAATDPVRTADPDLGTVLRLPPPEPGQFAGTLVWDRTDCTRQSVDLEPVEEEDGLPDPICSMWSAVGGGALAFANAARIGAGDLRVLVRATGRVHAGPERGGSTAVASDGTVATCGAARVLEQRPDGTRRSLPGCSPAYGSAGLLRITTDEQRVVDDAGRTVVPAGDGSLRLLAAAGDDVAVLRARTALGGRIEVWRDGRQTGEVDIGPSGQPNDVRLAPGGDTVLVRLRGPQEWALYRTRRPGSLAVIGREGLREGAFSPDGRYVAVVVASGVVIVDTAKLAPLAALPADAKEIAWLA